MEFELVVIDWKDAAFGQNMDHAKGDLLKPIVLRTVGFILRNGRKFVTMAAEYNPEDESTRHQMVIPKANIVKMHKIRFNKPFEDVDFD